MSRLSNRVKAIAVLVIVVTAVALGALLVLVAGPRLGLPALLAETPTATLVPGAEELGTQFLISKVGEAYFQAHYRFEKAEPTEWPNVVLFRYRYDYPPHVMDYQIFFSLISGPARPGKNKALHPTCYWNRRSSASAASRRSRSPRPMGCSTRMESCLRGFGCIRVTGAHG